MSKLKKYRGVVTPMVTPFKNRGGIDMEAAVRITEHLISCGAAPFALGTTGEAASISQEARSQFVSAVVRQNEHRMLVYAGISDNCLAASVEMAKQYADLGADVAVAHLPSYYHLDDDDIKTYYEKLADSIPIPLMMYNIPTTTGISISLHTLELLSHHPNIVGLKDSENNTKRLQKAMLLWKDRADFVYLMGCGSLCATALSMGSDGIVPGAANVVPKLFADLYEAGSSGRQEESNSLQELADTISAIYHTNRPLSRSLPTLKAIMYLLGFCQTDVMSPLRTLTPLQIRKIEKELATLKIVLGKQGYVISGPAKIRAIQVREAKHPAKDSRNPDIMQLRSDQES